MSSNLRGTVKVEVVRPKAVVKIHPPDEFETLANGDVTPPTITLISTVENFDFPTYVWSRFDGSSWIILGNKTPTLSVGFNKNAESWTERTFRVQVQGHTKNSTSNPSLNKIEGQTDWNLAIVQRKPYVEVGENYILMGFWDDKTIYKKSDLGVPMVKVPTTTTLKYSVFVLTAQQSTMSLNPNTVQGQKQWKLIDSTEMAFFQMAYIERLQAEFIESVRINTELLQAQLVTAERIEALELVTGNLTVTTGAKIGVGADGLGGWTVDGQSIKSVVGSGAQIKVEESGVRFLRINEGSTMLGIRTEKDTALSLMTQGVGGLALGISAQTGSQAIKSNGGHTFHQRQGEIWSSPGMLMALTLELSPLSQIGYSTNIFEHKWHISPLGEPRALRQERNVVRLIHNLGHSDYVPHATVNSGSGAIDKIVKSNDYFDIHIAGSYSYNDHRLNITIVGRNRL